MSITSLRNVVTLANECLLKTLNNPCFRVNNLSELIAHKNQSKKCGLRVNNLRSAAGTYIEWIEEKRKKEKKRSNNPQECTRAFELSLPVTIV